MKKTGLLGLLLLIICSLLADVPSDYYDSATGLTGDALKNELHDIIDNNTNTDYGGSRAQMYGYIDNHSNTVQCVYTGLQVSHNYGNTNDPTGINCEHTYCQSWYSGIPEESIAKADLHHLFPVKITVNSSRGNRPLDNVANISNTYSELTGYESYLGTNSAGEDVFEPADQHKGNAARALLYFAVRYEKGLTQGNVDMLNTLINWHENDPVDTTEENRNDDIYDFQGNANPFVDHPEFVDDIWGDNPSDTTPPEIVNITIQSSGSIIVNFTESVDQTTAETESNYSIDNSIGNPSSAIRGVDGNNSRVILSISSMTRGVDYNITINNVEDQADNTILPDSEKDYSFLATGDLVILGMNCDNNAEGYDDFAFMPLRDILGGTEIRFSDCGWFSSGSFRSTEGALNYLAPQFIEAGTVLTYYDNLSEFNDNNSDFSGSFALSTSGDQIMMFQGQASSPAFIYAVNNEGSSWQTDATSSNTSALPAQLTNGSTAVAVSEHDNVRYDGGISFASPAQCLNAVSDNSNWIGDHSNLYDFGTVFDDFTLPVILTNFTVEFLQTPIIFWTTATETNNAYWNVYRSISMNLGQAIWINAGEVIPGQGTTTMPSDYSYSDQHPYESDRTYWYWLESVDLSGNEQLYGPIELQIPEGEDEEGTPIIPTNYGLYQNYPNPFNPDTLIQFALKEAGKVELKIFNAKGEKIKTLLQDHFIQEEQVHSVFWNGTDKFGKPVASGFYFYRLKTKEQTYIRKMLLVK